MIVRKEMYPHFSLYARSTPIRQIVDDVNAKRVEFYVVVQEGAAFMVVKLGALKERLSALADDFGVATLDLPLANLPLFWSPQTALSPAADASDALRHIPIGEAAPVVENGRVVGVLHNPHRGIGSTSLSTLYGPRYALFNDPPPATPAAARQCPHCGKMIDYYKPKRVADQIERHCPNCADLIP